MSSFASVRSRRKVSPPVAAPTGAATRPHAEDESQSFHYAGETPSFPGGSAAFMAQIFAADERSAEPQGPVRDATKAYARFREERHAGQFIDVRDPVDVAV